MCSSMVDCLPILCKALGFILSIGREKKEKSALVYCAGIMELHQLGLNNEHYCSQF